MTIRRHAALAILLVSLVTGALAQTSIGIAYKYRRLYNSNSGWNIVPLCINNSNVIVGRYTDPDNTHGFIYKNGVFTTVDFPGADSTEAKGINDSGDVVGIYSLPAGNRPGFLLHQGVFTTIDFPGSAFTLVNGINNAGTIVGYYPDAKSNTHGFVYNNGTFKTVDAPHLGSNVPASTYLNGINNSGIILGGVTQGGAVRGFWLFGKGFHFLNAPGTADNFPEGMNAGGDVIGARAGYSYLAFSVPTQGMLNAQTLAGSIVVQGINDARILVVRGPVGKTSSVATPMLTLKVTSPANHTKVTNPVHVAAMASGDNAISQIEVWANNKKVYSVAGGTLDAHIHVPMGTNQPFVIRAVDSTGIVAKVVDMITVN
jgi:probable HAF family extracellular repeat protein